MPRSIPDRPYVTVVRAAEDCSVKMRLMLRRLAYDNDILTAFQ